jgi:thiamine-monophosphate kinase
MGAEPAWCTLSLSLPTSDEHWVDGFLDGFLELAVSHRVALVGGDTTRGPLSVCVTVHGFVEPGRALRRDAARVGDGVWASGTLGDAAAALALLESGAIPASATLRQRLDRPIPRVALGRVLSGLAHACIDVSDGLLADLAHVCEASGVGMRIALDRLPASDALRAACDDEGRAVFQASGGDDYELAFTAPADADDAILVAAAGAGVPVARIGEAVAGERVRMFDAGGDEWQPPARGYVHFDELP